MFSSLFSFLILFSSAKEMNLGFYDKDSSLIPSAVHLSKDKIFQITMPYFLHLSSKDYDGVIGAKNFPENTKFAAQKCKDENKIKCIVPFVEINGTAFLDKSPNYIWTNCHIVYEWMQSVAEVEKFTKDKELRTFFSERNIPLVLTDIDKNTVYKKSELAFLVAFTTSVSASNGCNSFDDLVKIKLSRPLASDGLSWANKNSSDTAYLGGFPEATSDRQELGKMDSDGNSFFWSFGETLDFKNKPDLEYVNQKPNLDFVLSSSYLGGVLADGIHGMSGAPVLNDRGELLGIYKGFVPLSKDKMDTPFISLYISTEGMRFVEIFSGHP